MSDALRDELSELARRLAAARRTDVPGVCPVCGTAFVGPTKQKYDKHSCAVIASRRNKRAAQKAAQQRGEEQK